MAITFDILKSNSDKGVGTTLDIPLPTDNALIFTAGDIVIIFLAMDNVAGTVSAADDKGNTWTAPLVDITNANGVRLVCLAAYNVAAGVTHITITHPSVTAHGGTLIAYKPSAGSSFDSTSFDASNSGTTNASTALTSNAATPSTANQLVIGAGGVEDTNNTAAPTQPAWVTQVLDKNGTAGAAGPSNVYVIGGAEVQTTATARTYNPTLAASADNAGIIVTFKEVAAAGDPFPLAYYRRTQYI